MIAMTLRGSLCAALILLAATTARAQDFRVSTQIRNVGSQFGGKPADRAPVGRSTALFHAGKVYDCLNSSQLTIFEPAQDRIVILDQPRRLKTVLPFDEIATALEQAEQQAEQKLITVQGSTDRAELNRAKLVRFQLRPQFSEKYDPTKRKLKLSSPLLTYTVQCEPAAAPEIVNAYLQFADWAARLNYVVNRNVPLPGPRLELNKALLRQNVLPAKVAMQWQGGLHLEAEHKFTWKLDPDDRETIRESEQLLHAPDVKQVPLSKLIESVQARSVTAKR